MIDVGRVVFPGDPRRSDGFTILELMIIVFIISILVVIAIPVYQNYSLRAKVTEMLYVSGPVKSKVAEYYMSAQSWPADNSIAGLDPPANFATEYVQSIEISNGDIIITSDIPSLVGETLILTPTSVGGGVDWECTGGTLEQNYRPAQCR